MKRLSRQSSFRLAAALLIFALNIYVAWRLLFIEYLPHFVSIEPLFFALARAIRDGKNHGWWHQWMCGMPFTYTYQPLLHYIVAGVSAVTGLSIARSFHAVFAVGYALGPVTLYFLALRLSRRLDVSLTAGLLYSLWSPAALLIPALAVDAGSIWNPLRLHSPVVYADSPYVFGLTFVPLAILLLDRAIEKPQPLSCILAGLGSIAVLLTNVPAFMSLVMASAAYGITASRRHRIRTWIGIAAAPAIGFLLAAPVLPISGLLLTLSNSQWMDPSGKLSNHGAAYCVTGALFILIAAASARTKVPRALRFTIVFALLTMAVVLGKFWFHYALLAEAGRFYLVMEMAIVLAISFSIVPLLSRIPHGTIALAAALLAFSVAQTVHYHRAARVMIRSVDIRARSEYKIARWMDDNAHGARVSVPGSVSFWMNALTDTPQLVGCCYQNVLLQGPLDAYYVNCADPSAENSITWLRALGVHYVAVCGPRSTEHYKVTQFPAKFDGFLPLRWRDGDDAIYELPSRSGNSLAHAVTRDELIQTTGIDGNIVSFKRYNAAVENPAHANLAFTWTGLNTARIEGNLARGELISVQIPYHFGWRATLAGHPVRISKDGIGFMTIEPGFNGPCAVTLSFTGGAEAIASKIIAIIAWAISFATIAGQFRARLSRWATNQPQSLAAGGE